MRRNTAVLLCFVACLVLLSTASAASHQQQQPQFNLNQAQKTLWDMVLDGIAAVTDVINTYIVEPTLAAVSVVVDMTVTYIVAPALDVVNAAVQVVVTPVTNAASNLAIGLAADQFCSMVVQGSFASINDNALVLAKCKLAAKEEIMKGFNTKWIEGADNSALFA